MGLNPAAGDIAHVDRRRVLVSGMPDVDTKLALIGSLALFLREIYLAVNTIAAPHHR